MRNLKFILLLIVTLILTSNAFSQQVFNGVVTEVLDGKTAVIELGKDRKITAEIDYIEIPEPEQQLHQTVKEHLQHLLLGKKVEFVARIMKRTSLIGRMYMENIDISQQMLRDGAAWYDLAKKPQQDAKESEIFGLLLQTKSR